MNLEKKLFSIVIPTYNYAETLARAVESALKQSGDDYEILVVDDGSTDKTLSIIKNLHNTYPGRFRSVSKANSGVAAARNYGVDHTTGDWLIFLDADDELMPDALSELRQCITENSIVKLIIGGHISIESNGKVRYRSVNPIPLGQEARLVGYLLKKTITPSNGATAMHRDIFNKCRYPEHFRKSEDISVFAYALTNFCSIELNVAINRIYKHSDSLRHNIKYADDIDLRLVDEVFRKDLIPECLQCYKRKYAAQRCLSLFRTFYLAGQKDNASKYYRKALSFDWKVLLDMSYLRKYLRLFFS